MLSILVLTGLVAGAMAQNSSCVTGDAVHMIIARASLEPPGTGVIGGVATQVMQQLPGSDLVPVDYPATLDNYPTSEAQGVKAMTALVMDYANRCPNSKMVLMGYSQGAQVTADVLCGTNENSFVATQALSTSITDKVSAAVLMGDPSKAQNETFLQGTSTKDGVFPRISTSNCGSMVSRMVSYCNANDTFCDSGSSIAVHLSYVQNNGTSAVNFVVSKVKGGASSGTGSGGNGITSGAAASGLARGGEALGWALGAMSLGMAYMMI